MGQNSLLAIAASPAGNPSVHVDVGRGRVGTGRPKAGSTDLAGTFAERSNASKRINLDVTQEGMKSGLNYENKSGLGS